MDMVKEMDSMIASQGTASDAECGAALEYFTNGPGVNHPKRNLIWRIILRCWQLNQEVATLTTEAANARNAIYALSAEIASARDKERALTAERDRLREALEAQGEMVGAFWHVRACNATPWLYEHCGYYCTMAREALAGTETPAVPFDLPATGAK